MEKNDRAHSDELDNFIEHDDAFDTQKLLEGVELSGAEEIDLEDILAEYGAREREHLKDLPEAESDGPWINEGYSLKPVHAPEERAAAQEDAAGLPAEEAPSSATAPEETPEKAPQQKEKPAEPQGIPLEEVMAQVVDAVMEEEEQKRREAQPVARRGLFSRRPRPFEETEPVYIPPEEPPEEGETYVEEPEEEDEDDGVLPERGSEEASADYHRRYKALRRRVRPALAAALLSCLLAAAQYSGALESYCSAGQLVAVGLALLLAQIALCLPVFFRAAAELGRKRCAPELLAALFAAVSAADGAAFWLLDGRGTQLPLCPVAAAALYFTLRGEMLRLRGLRDCCHMATYDRAPYVVSGVEGGFRKQNCSTEGFVGMTEQESEQRSWYHTLLPVIVTATTVFAVLTALSRADGANFLWYWSAILGGATSFAFTAAFGAPLGKLARRLQRDGCAVSGYSGARTMSRRGSMILTDGDLFPPGTVFMNGMKVYAHDAIRAVGYAASLTDASGSGLRQVFNELCRSQGAHKESVEDFSFYKEGGVAGIIRGESVILGRDDFMAQMGVRLPREINLPTGVFLAVDKELVAVFALKYMAADNVDAALQTVLHNGICPVFAVRDFNITPALIKRKFKINTKKRCLYPELSDRLAFSEEEHEGDGHPAALLFREGLMPYAETVVGGKRMHSAVRKNCAWALIGSICGTVLAFYLAFAGGFSVLTPLTLLVFQLLWCVPPALVNFWVTQY